VGLTGNGQLVALELQDRVLEAVMPDLQVLVAKLVTLAVEAQVAEQDSVHCLLIFLPL
jgi:hypothetical protein